ncbi:MAG: hypothetical protein KDE19_22310, partial [Caldilineaceae bacterium]|nr:hypothetical protein [Caldilineaceae bacterium]
MTQETDQSPAVSSPKRRSVVKGLLLNRRLWAVVIVVLGLWLMFFFGTRTLRAYRELSYAREQGLLNGTASVGAIQPWMTIRYIAVAYAVPEEYIYAKLDIPFDRRVAHAPLGRLGHQRPEDGTPPAPGTPPADPQGERNAIVAQVRAIILTYRENPVAPGLRDIRPWMSLAYIANSTGVPLDYLIEHVTSTTQAIQATESATHGGNAPPLAGELDSAENLYKPLDVLTN